MKKYVMFIVVGHPGIGLGHCYRVLDLYNAIDQREKIIVCTAGSARAYEFFRKHGVTSLDIVRDNQSLSEKIAEFKPGLVINDILNTSFKYVDGIKRCGAKVINFEDLGSGSFISDLTINSLYTGRDVRNIVHGYKYIDIRQEFTVPHQRQVASETARILITFGGEDPKNITARILAIIARTPALKGKEYFVLLGPANPNRRQLDEFINEHGIRASLIQGADPLPYMLLADMAISSNGRTPFELAAVGLPAVVISANSRECLHKFYLDAGFMHCGENDLIGDDVISEKITLLAESFEARLAIKSKLDSLDLRKSRARLLDLLGTIVA